MPFNIMNIVDSINTLYICKLKECYIISFAAQEELKQQDYFQYNPPKKLVDVPKLEVKWKIAPEYSISDELPVENARNILIATAWRSGSTFMGDILNHYPGTFYSFEPIHYVSNRVSNALMI